MTDYAPTDHTDISETRELRSGADPGGRVAVRAGAVSRRRGQERGGDGRGTTMACDQRTVHGRREHTALG